MEGYNKKGHTVDGYRRDGYHKATNRDRQGYSRSGFDKNGFDRAGFDKYGFDYDGYDSDGYDCDGIDSDGYDEYGFDYDGYAEDGYDYDGRDKNGYTWYYRVLNPHEMNFNERYFGRFECECGRTWSSAYTYKNKFQRCQSCDTGTFPTTQVRYLIAYMFTLIISKQLLETSIKASDEWQYCKKSA